jgi:hypothetical protein
LDRKEAIIVLKEIFDACMELDESWVALIPPTAGNVEAKGYQIHIRTKINGFDKKCVEATLQKYDLMYKEITNTAIIYRPIRT